MLLVSILVVGCMLISTKTEEAPAPALGLLVLSPVALVFLRRKMASNQL
jgi:hypothetical protein